MGERPVPLWGDTCVVHGQAYTVQSPGLPHSLRFHGPRVRFELRRGDRHPGDVWRGKGVERCELKSASTFPPGVDVWIAFSVRYAYALPSTWTVTGQLHQRPAGEAGGGPPAFAHRIEGGASRIHVRDEATRNARGGGIAFAEPVALDRWLAFVHRVRFDPTGDGLVRSWRDGERVVDVAGAVGYADSRDPHWKFGLYRRASSVRSVVEYANVEVGRRDLSDRIASPLPVGPDVGP